MPRTIYLHLGVHKTGTTSLQKLLAECHDALRARGICEYSVHSPLGAAYREFRRSYTKVRAQAARGAIPGTDDRFDAAIAAARTALEALLADCAGHSAVISDENMLGPPIGQLRARGQWESRFYPGAEGVARALAAIFEGFDVVPILCRRDAPGLVESLYGNSIQGLSFAGDIGDFLERIDVATIDYARLDSAIAQGLGRPVEWLDFALIRERGGEGLSRGLFEIIGAGDLALPALEQSNTRYNDAQVRLAREFAARKPTGAERRQLARQVRNLVTDDSPSFSATRLSEEQRAEISRKAAG